MLICLWHGKLLATDALGLVGMLPFGGSEEGVYVATNYVI